PKACCASRSCATANTSIRCCGRSARTIGSWRAPPSTFPSIDMVALLAAAVGVLFVLTAGLSWLVYGLLRQNGRILDRLEALEVPEAGEPAMRRQGRVFVDRSLAASRINRDGLKPGVAAPAFSLPTVDGHTVALADYAGRRVLLVFSDPECGPCLEMLPRLDAAARVSDVPLLVISPGGVDANRRQLIEARATLQGPPPAPLG